MATLRRFLLAMVVLGALGLGIELLLLEHYESLWQLTPLILLTLALPLALAAAVRPTYALVRALQALMVLCVGAGLLGVYLHYRGNVEFELERAPDRRGLSLFWESIRGATPTLASAALAQLGALGLAFAFRHPVLQGRRRPSHSDRKPDS